MSLSFSQLLRSMAALPVPTAEERKQFECDVQELWRMASFTRMHDQFYRWQISKEDIARRLNMEVGDFVARWDTVSYRVYMYDEKVSVVARGPVLSFYSPCKPKPTPIGKASICTPTHTKVRNSMIDSKCSVLQKHGEDPPSL